MISFNEFLDIVEYNSVKTYSQSLHTDDHKEMRYLMVYASDETDLKWSAFCAVNKETKNIDFVTVHDKQVNVVYYLCTEHFSQQFPYYVIYQSGGNTNHRLETDNDFVNKSRSIVAGVPYDTRIEVELTLSDDDILFLMKEAHRQNITVNVLVENLLQTAISKKGSLI